MLKSYANDSLQIFFFLFVVAAKFKILILIVLTLNGPVCCSTYHGFQPIGTSRHCDPLLRHSTLRPLTLDLSFLTVALNGSCEVEKYGATRRTRPWCRLRRGPRTWVPRAGCGRRLSYPPASQPPPPAATVMNSRSGSPLRSWGRYGLTEPGRWRTRRTGWRRCGGPRWAKRRSASPSARPRPPPASSPARPRRWWTTCPRCCPRS